MKLSEKLLSLRKENGLTQEAVAEYCNVSRQTVTKWECGAAQPEISHLLLLSRLFQTSTDVLLKEELPLTALRDVPCHSLPLSSPESPVFEGTLIKESLQDENVIDALDIRKTELWRTNDRPKYWTALFFTSTNPDLPDLLSRALLPPDSQYGTWFVDFKAGNTKYVVFHGLVLQYTVGDAEGKARVCQRCRQMGVPDRQMDWAE